MKDIVLLITGAFIAGIFTLMGCFITYFFNIRIAKRQEFNKFANKLRTTLINHKSIIDTAKVIKLTHDILAVAFKNVEKTFLEFEVLLCAEQRKSINIIWNEYNNKNKDSYHKMRFHTESIINSIDKHELRENLIKNIEKLIEFTKLK